MKNLIDLGKYSMRIKLRKAREDPIYFVKEILNYKIKITPLQEELIRKLTKSTKLQKK